MGLLICSPLAAVYEKQGFAFAQKGFRWFLRECKNIGISHRKTRGRFQLGK
jgi:hypothetical protein